MGAPGNDNSLAWAERFLRIGRMNPNPQRWYISAFVGDADIYHAHVGREKRMQKTHPRDYHRQGLVVSEEEIRFVGGGPKIRGECAVVFARRWR